VVLEPALFIDEDVMRALLGHAWTIANCEASCERRFTCDVRFRRAS
jgi:hypothetical protein